MPTGTSPREVSPPRDFQVRRDLPPGRYPLLVVFPGLDRLPGFRRLLTLKGAPPDIAEDACVEVVKDDVWMYVAPWELPPMRRRRGWKPVVAPKTDCIVVGMNHLSQSPPMVLYMDVLHEFCHILQRREGRDLWEPGVGYVDRPTEVEAYQFVVDEARERGASEEFLREYLKVDWVTPAEHQRLLKNLGVPPGS